jgi:hypothetical protein
MSFAKSHAVGDVWSAMRGWFIRELDRTIPPLTLARYAVIAELLTLAGVDEVDPTKVRAVLKRASKT